MSEKISAIPVLVTGAAGFVGFHLAQRLCREGGWDVLGVDNLNDYYDPALKKARIEQLQKERNFRFVRMDLADRQATERLFEDETPDIVLHLAAQAGVRYSLDNPYAYADSNLTGFMNILEGCRHHGVGHLVYASSSSVYGANTRTPFHEDHAVDHPVSLYAATKKANEMMAHAYAHLYGLPCTGLRFFTVYGAWGRPDMAYYKFTRALYEGRPIDVYNHGEMWRDFTYIDDVAESIARLLRQKAEPDPAWSPENPKPSTSLAPCRIYNIGNSRPVKLTDMIAMLEEITGIRAEREFLPMQPGDVQTTCADTSALEKAVGFHPSTPLERGLEAFVRWYRAYHRTD